MSETDVFSQIRASCFRIRTSKTTVWVVVSFALFIDNLIYGIVVPILPDFMEKNFGATASTTSFLFGAFSIGYVLACPCFGMLAHRYGCRTPMLASLAALAIATLVFSIGSPLWVLFIARFAQGVSSAGSWVVGMAWIYSVFQNPSASDQEIHPPPVTSLASQMDMSESDSNLWTESIIPNPQNTDQQEKLVDHTPKPPAPNSQSAPGQPSPPPSADEVGRIIGYVMSFNGLGFLSGPPLGGVLYEYCGFRPVFFVCIGFVGLDFFGRWICVDPGQTRNSSSSSSSTSPDSPIAEHSSLNQQLTSMWNMIQLGQVNTLLLGVIVSISLIAALEPLLPLYLASEMNSTPKETGALFLGLMASFTLSATPVGWLTTKFKKRNMMVVGMLTIAILAPCTVFTTSWVVQALLLVCLGCAWSTCLGPSSTELSEIMAQSETGSTAHGSALFNIAYASGMFGGTILAGLLVQVLRVQVVLVVNSLLCLIICPFVYRSQWQIRATNASDQLEPNELT